MLLHCAFRDLLKEIKQSGEIHLVLDCDFDKVHRIQRWTFSNGICRCTQCSKMHNPWEWWLPITTTLSLTWLYSFLLINLVDLKRFSQDLHLVDLEEFKYTGTNLTAFRMVDPQNEEVRKTVKTWNLKERFPGRHFGGGSILKVIK